jgi:SagB-type dehydrogenase family enzyme
LTVGRGGNILAGMDIGPQFQDETAYPPPGDLAPGGLKAVPASAAALALPRPEGAGSGLWEVLRARRSRRDYSGAGLALDELGALTWAGQGLTAMAKGHALRAAPSAGALYPLDLYAVLPGPEPAAGVWRYEPEGHALRPVLAGPALAELARAAMDQPFIARSAATFVLTAHPERSAWRYEQRAWRYFYLDAGGIGENLQLAAEALGLGACAVGAFYDSAVNELLGIDGQTELAIYLVAVGRRGDQGR